MSKKTIVVSKETHEKLRKYKSAKSTVKNHDLSYEEAIIELLEESKILREHLKGTK